MSNETWTAANGDWTTPSNWSGDAVPGTGDVATINSGTATVSSTDAGIAVGSIALGGSAATLAIADPGQTQTVTGAVTNVGALDVDLTGGGGSDLAIDGALSNSGAGADGVFIGNAAITQATTVSVVGLSNTGTITLAGGSAAATASLSFSGAGTDSGAIVMNSFGDLVVSGALTLYGGAIDGGTIAESGDGAIGNGAGYGAALNGVTIASGATYTDGKGSALTLSGAIDNEGTIAVGAGTGNATLEIAAAGAVLTGGGTVALSNSQYNVITGSGALVNVNNTIEGSGEVTGLGKLDNQAAGVIDADQSAPLTVYEQASGTLANEGVIEATSGGMVVLDASTLTQSGSGEVEAVGANSIFQLTGGTIVGGTLADSGGGVIENVGGNGGVLNGVTIESGTTYTDSNNSSVTLVGAIVNNGEIFVDSTGAGVYLTAGSGGATLTGGGTVALSNSQYNVITGSGALVNVNNTIEGSGEVTGLGKLDNQAAGVIDADQSAPLTVYEQASGTLANEGVIEATSGGMVVLDASTLTQSGSGEVEAVGANSIFQLTGGTIVGGTLADSGGGVIENVGGNGGVLNGVTIESGTTYTDSNNSSVTLVGAIVNNGEIFVDSTDAGVYLTAGSGGATLTGGGTVALSNSQYNVITGSGALVNVNNTIEGSGSISSLPSFDNEVGGTVNADQSTPLVISSISGGATNDGVFEATNGGTLHVFTAITGSGELLVQAGSGIDLGGATSETTAFTGVDGTLKLDTPTNYSGVISGFAVGDTLDLGNTTATLATPSADGLNTTLTVEVSGGSLTYTLAGDYVGDTFTISKSGNDSLITVTAGNAPPTLSAGATVDYLQGGAPVIVDGGLTMTDSADPVISGATVQITSGFVAGDVLNFTTQNGISGVYAPNGLLTLTGIAGITAYQDALESVTFSSTSADPTNAGADPTRAVTWIAGNGAANSTPVTSTIDVTALPELTAGAAATYTQGGAAAPVDSALTVSDASSGALTSATVAITDGFFAGDTLNFIDQNGITGSYSAGTGVLTLSGSATPAAYQTALDSITFSSTSVNPTDFGGDPSRTLSWQVTDANGSKSATATSTIDVVGVDQPPVLAGAGNSVTYTIGGAAAVLDGGLAVSDPDSLNMASATATISAGLASGDALSCANLDGGLITQSYDAVTGVLTLTGAASVAAYQAALESVTFATTSASPAPRTVAWQVNDETASSNTVTSTLDIAVEAPVLTAGFAATYTQGGAAALVDSGLTVADPSSGALTSATVAITDGFFAGDTLNFTNQNGITGTYSAASGVLTLVGSATLAAYQAALDSITFSSTSVNPTDFGGDPSRTISWQATDANGSKSAAATSTVSVIGVDQPPVLSGGGDTTIYTFTLSGGAAVAVDGGLGVDDPDNLDLAGATVAISGGPHAGDELNFTNQSGIAGNYNASAGLLTLTGAESVTAYEAALESVTFSTTSSSPSARTVSWQVTDGALSSNAATSTVDIAYSPPILADTGAAATYTQGGAAAPVDSALTVSDASSGALTSATVAITDGFFAGDTLNFIDQNGITGSYSAGTGVLTLSGSATPAAYQTALDSITFSSTSVNPTDFGGDPSRTLSWQVTDANGSKSATATSTIDVVGVDQPPVLAGAGNSVTYTIGGAAAVLDGGLAVSDPDSLNMASATATISAGLASGDALSCANLDGGLITQSYDAVTGVLTLTGAASVAAYQAALESVTFATTSASPAPRTVAWQVNDETASSNTVTSTLDIAVEAPVLTAGFAATYTQGGAAALVDSGLTVADPSSGALTSATVAITDGFFAGDTLNFTNQNGITGTYSAASGVLTLVGSATLAAYQAALESVTFSTTSASASLRTIAWQVADGTLTSNTTSSTVDISVPSTPPVLGGAGNTINWVQAVPPATVATPIKINPSLTVGDPGAATLTGAMIAVSSGFRSGDLLNFTNQNGIAGSYNAATGVLTLSGTASLAAYQTALESVTYSSSSTNPTNAGADSARTVTWTAANGALISKPATSTINIGQTYALTTGKDTIHAGAGNDTIVVPSPATLNGTDVIDGGGGTNTLLLEGEGTFNLAAPNTLADIQTVDIAEEPVSGFFGLSYSAVLDLRNAMNNVTVNVSTPSGANPAGFGVEIVGANNNDVINLGSGNDTVIVGSANETVNAGSGEDTIFVNSATIGATIHGGGANSALVVQNSDGGAVVMGGNITNVPNVELEGYPSDTLPYNFTANATTGLTVTDDSAGNDTLRAGGLDQTLVAGAGADTLIGTAQGGTTFDLSIPAFYTNETIENFRAPNDIINDNDIAYKGAVISYKQNNASSGTLTITDALFAIPVHLTLMGQFAAADFHTELGPKTFFAPGGSLNIIYSPT